MKGQSTLLIKKSLPIRPHALKAREGCSKLLTPSGVLKPGTEPVEGIFDSAQNGLSFPGIGAGAAAADGRPSSLHSEIGGKFVDLALQSHTEYWYKEVFCKHPTRLGFVEEMTGWGKNTLATRLLVYITIRYL